ncbi:MAG: ornithine carbamoyltransferase [Fibrobacteria bacterium]|nr:ornithine carbamoyltransferase [Fibrobacteria bacterium]
MSSHPKHLLNLVDLPSAYVEALVRDARRVRAEFREKGPSNALKGRTAALFFEKPSLRTRVTFEVAMTQTGGSTVILDPQSISLGKRESVHDAAKSLSRWVDCIVARTFSQGLVEELAHYATVPVINALTDEEHPCQALAFGEMLLERLGKREDGTLHDGLHGTRAAFIGDGNNVANSLAALAGHCGMHFTLACPEGFEQPAGLIEKVEALCRASGGSYRQVRDPREAVRDADVIYTDVWVSMGEEGQAAEKTARFAGYQVNAGLLAAAPADCVVTHCLPAHPGEEITQEVMDSPRYRREDIGREMRNDEL